jgi:diaminopimelate decarboxylase
MDISSVTEVNFQPGFSPRRLVVANKQGMSPRHAYGFYGPTMMPADKIAFLDAHYPRLEKGDVVVIENVGAYCTCHSKPWMRPRCAIYFLDRDSRIHLSRRRESSRDMIATQCY